MSRMPDNFVDLTVTSPPYDNLRLYEGYEWDFERVAQELFRVTKPGGVVVWVVNDQTIDGSESLTSCKQKIYFRENCGFNIHDTMIYRKKNFIPLTHNRYEQEFEYAIVLSKGKPKTFNPIMVDNLLGGKNISRSSTYENHALRGRKFKQPILSSKIKGNIWEYNCGTNCSTKDEIAFAHPAIFPERLAQDHIISWSNEREIIYDPFMGSGTVAKMCIATNRNYVGSEISKKYCDIAERRLQPYKSNIDMFYEQAKNTA